MVAVTLVVNEDAQLRALICESLRSSGYCVVQASSGFEALQAYHAHHPDLVITSFKTGDMDGLELCRRLKSFGNVLVLFLTSHSAEMEQLLGFAAGADEYMLKPFYPKVLVARVQSMLRRSIGNPLTQTLMTVGPLSMDTEARTAVFEGTEVSLTRIEFDLLAALMESPRRVVPKHELIENVWGSWQGDGHTVESHLSRLRAKVKSAGGPSVGVAVRGVGYKLGLEDSFSLEAVVAR